jgi:diguanylate cyclase (GGDEF)-like protein
MNLITESIEKEIGVDVCAIVLYPQTVQNKEIQYKIKTHLNRNFEDNLAKAIEEMCFEPYVENNFVYYDNRVDEKKYSFLSSSLMGSIMIMPLLRGDERIGVFFVGYPKYDFFKDNKQFFENIVSQFLIAIANANMYMKMETMAIKDGLTNIYNRRHLTQMFNEAMNQAILTKRPISVALFDIDKFKNVNDQYGHLFGDVVIKTVASLADQYAQESGGFAGRYGGEEFVIVFPNKVLEEAYEVVKKIHGEVKKKELEHNGMIVHITVSAGVTSYPETCSNPGELLNRADWAMYYSKEHGRDQITIDSDEVRKEVMIK